MRRRRSLRPILFGISVLLFFLVASVSAALYTTFLVYEEIAASMPHVGEVLAEGQSPDLDSVSPWVVRATVSTEDANFFTNPGLNFKGIVRAAVANLAGDTLFGAGGGSSITQQLAKNVLIPPDERYARSPLRKVKEALYAIELNRRYTKEEILSWYLGVIYYGNGAYGVESASQLYFGKPAADLDVAEATFLAGIPQWPVYYDPFRNFEACKRRQASVLGLMAVHGYITWAEAQQILDQPLALTEEAA
jgi:membrane peptidoglycan carboxypeptidase